MMTSSRSAQLQSLQCLTEMQEFLDFISNEGNIVVLFNKLAYEEI